MKELKDRLTFHEKNGNFGVVGMDETNQDKKVFACIRKLKDYEDLGFNPSELALILQMYDDMVRRLDEARKINERFQGVIKILEDDVRRYRNNAVEWVPVSEDLPAENVRVLVVCKTQKGFRSHNLAYYANGHWHGTGSMSGVTHWAELPVLPIE